MRLQLEGCPHPHGIAYETVPSHPDRLVSRCTCISCYERLLATYDFTTGRVVVQPDTPAVKCMHTHKKAISEAITRQLPYQDALCTDCGRVLRHPDGPGEWTEVRFYGYTIQEEP